MTLPELTKDLPELKPDTIKPSPKQKKKLPRNLSKSKEQTKLQTETIPQVLPLQNASPDENLNSVSVEIEQPEPENKSLFAGLVSSISSAPKEEKADKPKSKKEQADAQELANDFPTIITSLIALTISALSVPEEIKPNDNEIAAVSYHASRIMLRHIDVTNKLNADALDLIGIVATGAGWYVRVKDHLKPAAKTGQVEKQKEVVQAIPVQTFRAADTPGGAILDDPTAVFLERSAAAAEARQ